MPSSIELARHNPDSDAESNNYLLLLDIEATIPLSIHIVIDNPRSLSLHSRLLEIHQAR
jgi:hypothetical protein